MWKSWTFLLWRFAYDGDTARPVGQLPRGGARAGGRARDEGMFFSFDPNLRLPLWPSPAEARAQILWSLCQADVVKLSDEEVDFLWGCSPQEGLRRLLEECGVSLVMVTLVPGAATSRTGGGAAP